jgi:hypothetical protein
MTLSTIDMHFRTLYAVLANIFLFSLCFGTTLAGTITLAATAPAIPTPSLTLNSVITARHFYAMPAIGWRASVGSSGQGMYSCTAPNWGGTCSATELGAARQALVFRCFQVRMDKLELGLMRERIAQSFSKLRPVVKEVMNDARC